MKTSPVRPSSVWRRWLTSTPSAARRPRRRWPNSSPPTTPTQAERPPSRATPTATLASEPPIPGVQAVTSRTRWPARSGRKSTRHSPTHPASMGPLPATAVSVQPRLGHEVHALEAAADVMGDEDVEQPPCPGPQLWRQRRALAFLEGAQTGQPLRGNGHGIPGPERAQLTHGAAMGLVEARMSPQGAAAQRTRVEAGHEARVRQRRQLEG